MTQYGSNDGRDVVVSNVIARVRERARFRSQHDELRGTNAGSVVGVLLYEIWGVLALWPCGPNQVHNVAGECFCNRHHTHELLEIEELFRRSNGSDIGGAGSRCAVNDS